SFDPRPFLKRLPIHFHFNFGFLLDNSLELLPASQCASSSAEDACIRSRLVERFGYNIGSTRLRMALGMNAPLTTRWLGVEPLFEYHLEPAVSDGDTTVSKALRGSVFGSQLNNRVTQYMTLGVRVRPVAGLVVSAGVDIGLQSPGLQFGSPQPPWNVLF